MKLGNSIAPRTATGLRLTPGLRHGLSVLRMHAADLAGELRDAAAENPLIRIREPETGRTGWQEGAAEALAAPEGLAERLRRQIALMPLDPSVAALARFLTGDVGDDGYLDPDAAANVAALGAAPDLVAAAIAALQACEPAGIGARSLAECLALQMRDRGVPEATARVACAHLDLLAERRLDALSRLTGLPCETLHPLAEMLPTLTPRPWDGARDDPMPAAPEILVERGADGLFRVTLDRSVLPCAEIDRTLADGLGNRAPARAARAQALGLIRALQFRERTLLAVVRLIVTHQHRFFAEGPEHLEPMTRADIARDLDLHPSTVGRAVADKTLSYRGTVHPLAQFVSPPVIARGNARITAHAVRTRIRQLIASEPPHAVLSDDEISDALREEDIDIARRTVAKYRRCMGIPSSFDRRRQKAGRDETRPDPVDPDAIRL